MADFVKAFGQDVDGLEDPEKPDAIPAYVMRQQVASGSRWSAPLLECALFVEALFALLLAPRVGGDVEYVAVLGEAIYERSEARSVTEDRAPLLVGKVGGDHDCAALVSLADDAKEEVCSISVAWHVAELVQNKKIAVRVAAQSPLDRGDGLAPEQIRECTGECREADRMTLGQRSQA